MPPKNVILLGDCLDVLKTLPDASVDAIVTDPPYGLGTREPTLEEIIEYLTGTSALDTGGDFMGRDWSIPPVAVWRECYRVLKPGGHLLSFGGTRTFDLISLGIRAAGFENRDTVATQFGATCLQWIHGQGFPKGVNISKALEKAGAPPEVVERWRGYNTALKPAWEPILVFRKPIEEPTLVDQMTLTGTGALNIDATRVSYGGKSVEEVRQEAGSPTRGGASGFTEGSSQRRVEFDPKGRWPANVLLVHSEGCKVIGSKRVPAPVINRFTDGMKPFGEGAGHNFTSIAMGDADGMEEVPVYDCEPGCVVKILDDEATDNSNAGSKPSRFFGQFRPKAPFFYTSKVSKSERNKGLSPKNIDPEIRFVREDLSEDDRDHLMASWSEALPDLEGPVNVNRIPPELQELFEPYKPGRNLHPTVKPISLMTWAVQLVCPVGGVVLDPYCGSGTTCIAALEADCEYIGIERDPDSKATGENRIAGMLPEIENRAAVRRQQATTRAMHELALGND